MTIAARIRQMVKFLFLLRKPGEMDMDCYLLRGGVRWLNMESEVDNVSILYQIVPSL